jgi:hypothetical protein
MTTELIDSYFRTWNETDAARRADLAARTFAAGARYVDPNVDVAGPADFSEMVAAVQGQYPGYRFRLGGTVERHHDLVRFAWEILDVAGNVAMSGLDVGQVASDGRFACLHGFYGLTPSAQGVA